jgi:hypothetical protein
MVLELMVEGKNTGKDGGILTEGNEGNEEGIYEHRM